MISRDIVNPCPGTLFTFWIFFYSLVGPIQLLMTLKLVIHQRW